MTKYYLIGLIVAIVKIIADYPFYKKVKNEKVFHGVGLFLVAVIFTASQIYWGFNWKGLVITILVYWNVFEMVGNLVHKQSLFYVGKNAQFDKFLQSTGTPEAIKFFIHIVSIIIILILSL